MYMLQQINPRAAQPIVVCNGSADRLVDASWLSIVLPLKEWSTDRLADTLFAEQLIAWLIR
jgi:hypothetical protein